MAVVRREAIVKITGGFRRAAVIVETTGIDLRPTAGGVKGKAMVEFDRPGVDLRVTLKGGRNASYKVELTINGKTKSFGGHIAKGIKHETKKYAFSSFDLD